MPYQTPPIDSFRPNAVLGPEQAETPFSKRHVSISQEELIELKRNGNYYRSQFQRLRLQLKDLAQRIEALKKQHHIEVKALKAIYEEKISTLEAKVRLREQQLFGKKTEKGTTKKDTPSQKNTNNRSRGQQKGQPGHGRNTHDDLPEKEEFIELPLEQRCCPTCSKPYMEFPETEDSEIVEIKVKAYKRCIHRKRYKTSCHCAGHSKLLCAPVASRLIPKGKLGVSIWVMLLLGKFNYYYPTARQLRELSDRGLNLSQGTITDGLKRISCLFDGLYEHIIEHNQGANRWHADETRWSVYEEIPGKIGYRWYLWVFRARESVVYKLNPSRSSAVPKDHFKSSEGILTVDRFSSYKAMQKTCAVILSYCWAHVRRDFLDLAKKYPEHEAWAMAWVHAIGEIYHLNHERLKVLSDKEPFIEAHSALRERMINMFENLRQSLAQSDDEPPLVCKKVLISLKKHWKGLRIFVKHPEVPMDNNLAENSLRGAVVLRKNSRGSGRQWSGELAAKQMTILETLKLWNINVEQWMREYLTLCADHGGKVPPDWEAYLPWKMTEERLSHFGGSPPLKQRSKGEALT